MEKQKKYPGIEALADNSDPYGEEYKKIAKGGLMGPVCFACGLGLPRYMLCCRMCQYEYYFCKKCWSDCDIFVNRMRCIFCERKRNDQICELLRKAGIILAELSAEFDLYHDKIINKLLEH